MPTSPASCEVEATEGGSRCSECTESLRERKRVGVMVSSDDIEGVILCDEGVVDRPVEGWGSSGDAGLWVMVGMIAVTIVALSQLVVRSV